MPSSESRLSKIWRNDRVLAAILLAAVVLGVFYNFIIIPSFGPDEPRHFAYVRLLWEEQRFPFIQPDGKEYHGAHSLHPPLYYLLLLPLFGLLHSLPEPAIYHGLRFISLLLCAGSLPLLYDIARRACGSVRVARLSCAIFGLLPILGMTSGTVNNDSASVFAVMLFCWVLSRINDELPLKTAALLGLVFGLGMLCKATVALCDGAALIAFLWMRFGLRSAQFWRAFAVALFVAFIVALPWYARNFAMYGKFSPIENGYSSPNLPNPSNGILVMMLHDNFPRVFAQANWGIFYSLWSQKDWIPEAIRNSVYFVLVAAVLLATIGHIKNWRKREVDRSLRVALYAAFALNWAACAGMAVFVHWGWAEGGRYLVAAMPSLAVFCASGWDAFGKTKIVLATWCTAALALNAVCIYWLLAYLNPTFGPK